MLEEFQSIEKPFHSFTRIYKILIWAGYYKLLNKPKNRFKRIFHQIYRPLAFLVAFIYNSQHLIFIGQMKNDKDARLECLMTEIPQINLLSKILTINLQSSKIDKIHDLLNDPIFAANNNKDEEYLIKNRKEMCRLSKAINVCVTVAGILWPMSHIVRRTQNESTVIPFYAPFKTDTWAKFTLAAMMQVVPLLWVGYGHMTMDALVAAYYAQAYVQLKVIKYNLRRLFDSTDATESRGKYYDFNFQYGDVLDKTQEERFVCLVKRYERVMWYTNEVNRVFNPSMSFQFLTSSAAICMVIYKMSGTYILSVPFIFLFMLILVLLIQVFLYCYYGNLVRYESQSVNTSLYLSDWQRVSPRFRRQLLIAMSRWSRPLTTQVAGVIPLSLDTFISIVRTSYSLYTMLTTKHILTETFGDKAK